MQRNLNGENNMTNRERERRTLDFQKPEVRGAVEETFYPWSLTAQRYKEEGIPEDLADRVTAAAAGMLKDTDIATEKYFPVAWGDSILEYEQFLGFDPVRRTQFVLPFRRFEEKILEVTPEYTIKQDSCGRQMIRKKGSQWDLEHRQVIECWEDWKKLKEHALKELESYTDDQIYKAYSPLKEGHDRGDYSIRLHMEGFFWTPRELLGFEPVLYAFYDEPELLHDINDFICKVYKEKAMKVFAFIQPDVVYFNEDLSGVNGPLISPECFDEFVGAYYKELIPMMKETGVGNVIVDTDGEFSKLIPHFLECGVDGFLPMDVNAGMDIVKIREMFPRLKFIGGYNKLRIAEGRGAIDREFERILPVIRGGGYIPGADHQVPPSASLKDYRYYIERLTQVMEQAGADLPG